MEIQVKVQVKKKKRFLFPDTDFFCRLLIGQLLRQHEEQEKHQSEVGDQRAL